MELRFSSLANLVINCLKYSWYTILFPITVQNEAGLLVAR